MRGEERKIEAVIIGTFEAGKNRNFAALSTFYANDSRFSKFDDTPPFTRQNFEETIMQEEIAYASLSDFDYRIDDLRIDLFGNFAIATFTLQYGGVLVNNYTFEGRKINNRSRATLVLENRMEGWLIVHKHLSQLPEREGEKR